MEENAKQITLHLLFNGRPQNLAGISATQIREAQCTFPGQETPTGSLFLPAAMQGQARLVSQCHLLLSSSLLHCHSSMDTVLRHYCLSKRGIT